MAGFVIDVAPLPGTNGQVNPELLGPVAGRLGSADVYYGALTATRPARSPDTTAGYVLRDWRPDYLDRVIVTVDSANFGTVAGVVERTLTIWNRYRTAKSVTAQDAVGAAGISIIGWPALPFALAPTEERSWAIQAAAEGDPVIAGYLTFTIGGEELRSADLSGIRAIIFPHPPNWESPPEVGRGYEDNTVATISLAEARDSHGDVPLLDARFSVLALDRDEAASLARTLERTRALPVGMPMWTEAVQLTAAAIAGDSVLAVGTTSKRKFTTARPFVLLWQDWRTWAIAEISVLLANQITLTSGLLAGWPAGTQVVPVRFGKLALDPEQDLATDRVRGWDVNFEEKPL